MTNSRLPRRAIPLALILALLALVVGAPATSSIARQPAATTDHMFRSVQLVIHYGDDVEKRYAMLPWTLGMTAHDALKLASDKPAPLGLPFDAIGNGETLFVRAIDGLVNEGGKPGNRNWTYAINDKKATKSCGVATLEHGDIVTWRYQPLNPPAKPQ